MGVAIAAVCLLIFVYLLATNKITLFKNQKKDMDKGCDKYSYTYLTDIDEEKCIRLLSQKSVSKIFEYEFQKDENDNIYTITFEAILRYFNPCGRCTYMIAFEPDGEKTRIELKLKSRGDKLFALAFDVEMDEFMLEMLNAENVKTLEAKALLQKESESEKCE